MKKIIIEQKIRFIERILRDDRTLYSPKEFGHMIGRSDQFVRNLIAVGILHAFDLSKGGSADGKSLKKRRHFMIPREELILYILSVANLTPQEFVAALKEFIKEHKQARLNDVLECVDGLC